MSVYFKGDKVGAIVPVKEEKDSGIIKWDMPFNYQPKFYEMSSGKTFLGSDMLNDRTNKNIYMIDEETKSIICVLDYDEYGLDPSKSYHYFTFFEDSNGNIFVGLTNGVTFAKDDSINLIYLYDESLKKFKPVLNYTFSSSTSLSSNKPTFTEVNDIVYCGFTNVKGLFYYDSSNNDFNIISGTENMINFKEVISYNGLLLVNGSDGTYLLNEENKSASKVDWVKKGTTISAPYFRLVNNKLFIVQQYSVAIFNINDNKIYDIYYSGTYRTASPESAYIYHYNGNYFYYDKGPNLQGVILVNPDTLEYSQVIPPNETNYAENWSNFIETDDGLFLFSEREYTPVTWANKWDESNKTFIRVSDILGYKYKTFVYNGEIYFRCINATTSSNKYNIYKYNRNTEYFDTIVATTDGYDRFYICEIGNKTYLFQSTSKVYIMGQDGLFTNYMTGPNTSFYAYGVEIFYTLNQENGLFIIKQPTETGSLCIIDTVNNTISSVIIGSTTVAYDKFTQLIVLEGNLILINGKSSSLYYFGKYNSSTKKFDTFANLISTSYQPFKFVNNVLFFNNIYAMMWDSNNQTFKLSNIKGTGVKLKNGNNLYLLKNYYLLFEFCDDYFYPYKIFSGIDSFNYFGKYIYYYTYIFEPDINKYKYYLFIGEQEEVNNG